MTPEAVARHQAWIYLAAILVGLAVGSRLPGLSPAAEAILWPALAVLLYVTFTQVPLAHLPAAVRDRRFALTVLVGNFVLVPIAVFTLIGLFGIGEPAIRLGVLLVLLVPCTDWFITFTHLGRGDPGRAIAITPLTLVAQFVLLPGYLVLFMGASFVEILAADRIATVFVLLIIVPLAAAIATEHWVERAPGRGAIVTRLGLLPVPILALVVLLIAASQVGVIADALPGLAQAAGVFGAYLVTAALLALALARVAGLPTRPARTLVFSLGTRNSFVVLPLALALAPEWQTAVAVIVLQSLVELFGMVGYLWLVPRVLVPDMRRPV